MIPSAEQDRRNDVGTKIILAVYSSVIAILLGLFINAAWHVASEGRSKAEALESRVSKLEVYYISVGEDLREIKDLLKRKIPLN